MGTVPSDRDAPGTVPFMARRRETGSDSLSHLPFDTQLVDSDAERLLLEWYRQWAERDDMPPKMSNALHVRTAAYFVMKYAELRRQDDSE